jgi:hypothetical protein
VADNLTSRGARANTAARLPALPASVATDPARRAWEEMVREWLEVRLGARGDFYERAVTHRELQEQLEKIQLNTATTPEEKRLLGLLSALQAQVAGLSRQFSLVQSMVVTNVDSSNTAITNIYEQVRGVAVEDVVVFARDMLPSVTGGCSALTTVEFASTQPNLHALLFDATVDESADFNAMLPFSWAGRMYRAYVYWGHGSGGSAFDVVWDISANSTSDNESVILDLASEAVITDTGGVAGNLYIAAVSDPIPIASNTNRNGDLVSLRIHRRPTHASDTLNIDAYLLAVRFTLSDVPFPDDSYDPYWANVSLLVQGGTDGGLTINDLSSYADTATISANASFTNAQQVFGANMIRLNSISPAITPFDGNEDRFSRQNNEDTTVEAFVRYNVLENISHAGPIWYWYKPGDVDRLAELYVSNYFGAPYLWIRQAGTETRYAALTADTTYFIQLTVIGNTFYLDLGVVGVAGTTQVGTGSFITATSNGTYNVWVAAGASASSSGSSNAVWVGPVRWTKGVARTRGTVPTAAFPTR